ncbi:MAG: hypothetical protein QM758_15480 [Armatimonas sp.]
MNTQTRIIVATAVLLVAIDLAVRAFLPVRNGGVVSAREIQLVDRLGRPRAVLTTDAKGEPGLLMYDAAGRRRLQLDTFQSVPSLILNDENEERRVYFGMDERNGAGLYQSTDANGNWVDVQGVGSFTQLADPTMGQTVEYSQTIERAAPAVQVYVGSDRVD